MRDWESIYEVLTQEWNRPTWDEYAMLLAITAATRSTCTRAQNGAVVFRDRHPISTGYNGALSGQPHCQHHDSQPCTVAVHAEANAVYWAAREGVSLQGGHIYTTMSPCRMCAQAIAQAGIMACTYLIPYRDDTGRKRLMEWGVKMYTMDFSAGMAILDRLEKRRGK